MTDVLLDTTNYIYTDIGSTEVVSISTTDTVVLVVDNAFSVLLESEYGVYTQNPEVYNTIQSGAQGPKGAPGDSEENNLYSKRVDFVSEDLLYKGEAEVGSLESSAVWRIRKITISVDGDVTEIWAGGTADFDKVWASRLVLSYI